MFGPSFLPELREILLSVGEATSYGPDGMPTEVRDEPFLGGWQLRGLAYDPKRGRSRVVCVLTATDGRDVTATIDASDFRDLRGNTSRSRAWNGSASYHDLAVAVSVLIEEQIITQEPGMVPDRVRIQSPADRPRTSGQGGPKDGWWVGTVE
jgi:hypothetical protein